MNKGWLVGFALPAIAGIAWTLAKPGSDGPPAARPMVIDAPRDVAPSPPIDTSPARKTPIASDSVDSRALTQSMSTKDLQVLLEKDPAAALDIARRDFAKDPHDPDAAERNWVIVKSLAVLGRYEEAKREAEVMVPKFRDTRWANDVERHVLAHP